MNYAARLDRLTKMENSTESSEEMAKFTRQDIHEMGRNLVDFGEAHHGQTYDHVWNHHKQWLKFILNKYAESPKMAHRKLIHYTMMKIERTELEQGIPEQLPLKPKLMKAYAKPKAKSMAAPTPDQVDVPDSPDELEEIESFIAVEESHQNQNQENIEALQVRMLHMESAIGEILRHLRHPNA